MFLHFQKIMLPLKFEKLKNISLVLDVWLKLPYGFPLADNKRINRFFFSEGETTKNRNQEYLKNVFL